jgi:hypothetical protein
MAIRYTSVTDPGRRDSSGGPVERRSNDAVPATITMAAPVM